MNNRMPKFLLAMMALTWSGPLVCGTDRYVSLEGGHVSPFTSWADAATNIQAAIEVALPLDTIWVTNGIYATGGKAKSGDLTNRVALDKAVSVRSVNGSAATVIEGAWHPGTTNGATAVRCAWVGANARLDGFTLRGGATRSEGHQTNLMSGGGAWCFSALAVITNCEIRGNAAFTEGGGCFGGTIRNSLIEDNSSNYGAGVSASKVEVCTVRFNRGGHHGGGAMNSQLLNSSVISNSANAGAGVIWSSLLRCNISGNQANNGGGAYGSQLTNCVIANNASVDSGAGVSGGTAVNCAVIWNHASRGAGAWNSTLLNCTIAGNTATASGGGVRNSTVYNGIIWGNTAPIGANIVVTEGTYAYTCSAPLPPGTGNSDADPQLQPDAIHVAVTSPCRGGGNAAMATGLDIDGQPWADVPSMGCDEAWQAPLSISIAAVPIVEFPSHPGVRYALDYATNLNFPILWQPIQSQLSTGIVTRFTDSAATGDARFYRIRVH